MLHIHRTTENKTQEQTNFYAQNIETKNTAFQNQNNFKPLGGDPPDKEAIDEMMKILKEGKLTKTKAEEIFGKYAELKEDAKAEKDESGNPNPLYIKGVDFEKGIFPVPQQEHYKNEKKEDDKEAYEKAMIHHKNRLKLYRIYVGYDYYGKVLPILRRILRKQIWFNAVKSWEAIEAYHILDDMQPEYREIFANEEPILNDRIFGELPIEFRTQQKSALQKGIASKDHERLTKDLEKAIKTNNILLIKLLIAIAIEAGLEKTLPETIQQNEIVKGEIAKLGRKTTGEAAQDIQQKRKGRHAIYRRNLDKIYQKNAFKDPREAQEAPDQVDKDAVIRGKEAGGIGKMTLGFLGERLSFYGDTLSGLNADDDPSIVLKKALKLSVQIGKDFLGKTNTLESFDLERFQGSMGGSLMGLEVSKTNNHQKDTLFKDDEKKVSEEDKQDMKNLENGNLSAWIDFRNGEIKVIANAIPFKSLNYLAGDMAFKATEGAFNQIFMKMKWNPKVKKEEEVVADIDLVAGGVVLEGMRMITDEETYGIGKILAKGLQISMKQTIGIGKDLKGWKKPINLLFNTIGAMNNMIFLLINSAMVTYQRLANVENKQDEFSMAQADFTKALGASQNNFFDLKYMKVADIVLQNFYSTSMGRIGEIGLGGNNIKLQSDEASFSQDEKATLFKKKKELKKLQGKLEEVLDRRANMKRKKQVERFTKKPKLTKKQEDIEKLEVEIAQLEKKHNLKLGFETSHLELKEADMIQEMMAKMLKESFKESGMEMEGVQGLDGFELPQGLKLGTFVKDKNNTEKNTQISPEQIKDLSIDVPKIVFLNPVTASKLTYTGKKDLIDKQTNQPIKEKGKTKKEDTMQVIGTDVVFTKLELGLKIDFADYDKSKPPKEEDSLIENMEIKGLKAETASFGTFQFKLPNPFDPIKKVRKEGTKDETKDETNFYDVLDFKDQVTFHDFDFSFLEKAEDPITLKIGKIEQTKKTPTNVNGMQYNYRYKKTEKNEKGEDVETNIKVNGSFSMLNKIDPKEKKLNPEAKGEPSLSGLTFTRENKNDGKKDIDKILLGKLFFQNNKLENFYFKQGDLEVKGNNAIMEHIDLEGLVFEMQTEYDSKDKKNVISSSEYLRSLQNLFINRIHFGSNFIITKAGKEYKLGSGSIDKLNAKNLELDFQGKDKFEMFKKGEISFAHFNLSNLALDSLSKLNYFNLKDFSIERVKDAKEDVIKFKGEQSIGYHKNNNTSSLNVGAYSKLSGIYDKKEIMTKDENEKWIGTGTYTYSFKTDLDDFGSNIALSDDKKDVKTEIGAPKISIKTDFETYADIDFGDYISMKSLNYESKDGMYIRGSNYDNGLIRLENPSAKLKLVKDKKTDKFTNIEIEQFHLKKIVASKLDFGQYHKVTEEDKKSDLENKTEKYKNYSIGSIDKRAGYEDATFALKNGKTASLTDVYLSGNFRLSDGALALKGGAKEVNLEELKAVLSQSAVFLNPYLKADNLTFSREYNGDMDAKVNNFRTGLRDNEITMQPNNMGMIKLEQSANNKDTPVLQSHTLTYNYNKKEDKTEVIIKDPKLGAIVLEGHFRGYNGTSGIALQKMIMQGEMKGDFKLTDTPTETILDGKDFIFQIPEAYFVANSMSDLFSLTKPEEKKEQNNSNTNFTTEEDNSRFKQLERREYAKLDTNPDLVKNYVKNQARERLHNEKKQEEFNKLSQDFAFMNLFTDSSIVFNAFGEEFILQPEPIYATSLRARRADAHIDVFSFLKSIADLTANRLIELYSVSFQIPANNEAKGFIQILEYISKWVAKNGSSAILQSFENFVEERCGNIFKEVGDKKYIQMSEFAALCSMLGDMQEDLIERIMEVPIIDFGKGIYDFFSEPSSEPVDPEQLIPSFVEMVVSMMQPRFTLHAKGSGFKDYNKGMLKPYMESDFTKQAFSSEGFLTFQLANNRNPLISLQNWNFEGFSLPISKGKGKLSTKSMGISQLTFFKQNGLKKSGLVNLDAKNVYLKGLYMIINKTKDTDKEKKTGK
ncbi:MAG: hypothetical protein MUC49_15475 [Raineya sp.]|jgi:hypothetical protein|nr:hypothetical protein [Raineya sp.]